MWHDLFLCHNIWPEAFDGIGLLPIQKVSFILVLPYFIPQELYVGTSNLHSPILFFFEETEGFAWEIRPIDILGIKNITKLVTGKGINTYLFKPDPAPSRTLHIPKGNI